MGTFFLLFDMIYTFLKHDITMEQVALLSAFGGIMATITAFYQKSGNNGDV